MVGSSNIKALLFDLDGTLLRVQMSEFIPRYISGLAGCCEDLVGFRDFERGMLSAIRALIQFGGDGVTTNAQRFFLHLEHKLNVPASVLLERLELYRQGAFAELESFVKPIPLAQTILAECQLRSIPLVLATNPVFPEFMIEARLRWGGLESSPFIHVTSFENCRHCKPHPGYFQDIADVLQVSPQECLMIGNDDHHDLAAAAVGMQTYLVDTWLVQREGGDLTSDYRGDHLQLRDFLRTRLPAGG